MTRTINGEPAGTRNNSLEFIIAGTCEGKVNIWGKERPRNTRKSRREYRRNGGGGRGESGVQILTADFTDRADGADGADGADRMELQIAMVDFVL